MMSESKCKKKKDRIINRSGFTLLEVLCASVITGIGFIAILSSVTASTEVTYASSEMTQATLLTQEIREWTTNLPFSDPEKYNAGNSPGADSYVGEGVPYVDDLDDLMEVTFSPPRNGLGEAIEDMDGWSQSISLTWGSSSDINTAVVPGTSEIVQVQVTISKDNKTVMQTSWLMTENSEVE